MAKEVESAKYDWGNSDSWIDGGEHGLWIASGEVRSIEFCPVVEQGANNGGQKYTNAEASLASRSTS